MPDKSGSRTMKITDYRIVTSNRSADVSAQVSQLIAEGWQPLDLPFVQPEGLSQVLLKYAPDDPAATKDTE
jgi:hypothetical protein